MSHEPGLDAWLEKAQAGDAEAQESLARDYAARRQYSRAARWFERAAAAGRASAWVGLGQLHWYQLLSDSDPQRALRLWGEAAAAGAAEAPACLADAAMLGRYLHAGEESICEWLVQAAVRGHEPTQEALVRLIGAPLKPSRLLEFMQADCKLNILRESPRIATIDSVLDQAACDYVIARARPKLTQALVFDPRNGTRVQHPLRNNRVANLGFDVDIGILLIEYRMLRAAGAGAGAVARAEPMSALCYGVGEEYKPHRDYLNAGAQPDQFPPRGPGQRTLTVFCYLSDVAQGGETHFPTLNIKVTPKAGRIVLFENLLASGEPDPSTLHASLPVQSGEKWLATLWLRQHWAR